MTNPFLGPEFLGGRQDKEENPFLSGPFGSSEEDELSTAVGRRRTEATNIAQNRERLQAIRLKTKDEEQKKRIDRLLAELGEDKSVTVTPFGVGLDPGQAGRGALAGLANAIPSAIDLALTPADLAGLDAAGEARKKLAERQQLVRETVGAKGTASDVGEFAGGVAGGALPYGMAASATGRVASKLIPGLAKQIAAGKVSTSVAKRIIANVGENVIGGSIINSLQAAGLPDADIKDKLKALGIGIGADILFGVATAGAKPPLAATKALAPDEVAGKDLADKLQAEGKKRLVQKEAESTVRKLAKADWQLRNPTGNWQELTKAQKDEIYNAMKVKLTAEGLIKKEETKGPDVGGEGEAPPGATAPLPPKAPSGGGAESRLPSPEQLRYLRDAGGEDDPYVKEIRSKMDLTRFEKEEMVKEYRRRLEQYRANMDATNPGWRDTIDKPGKTEIRVTIREPGTETRPVHEVWDSLDPTDGEFNRAQILRDLGLDEKLAGLGWNNLPDDVADKIRIDFDEAHRDSPIGRVPDVEQGRFAPPDEFYDNFYEIVEDGIERELTDAERAQIRNAVDQAGGNELDANPEVLDDVLEGVISRFKARDEYAAGLGKVHERMDKEPPTPLQLGIKRARAPTGQEFWDSIAGDQRDEVLADWLETMLDQGINTDDVTGRYNPEHLAASSFNDLPPEIQEFVNRKVIEQNPVELDVGRTVNELDAARRQELAHPTVPKDISGSFTDVIIDAVQQDLDESTFVQNLIKFARENELADEAVFNSLEDATGWKPVQAADGSWTIEGSPLGDAADATPSPAPLIPEPAEELPLPTKLPGASPLSPSSNKQPLVPGAISRGNLVGLELSEIDKLKDRVFDALDADPNNKLLMDDLNALAAYTRAMTPVKLPAEPLMRARDVPPEQIPGVDIPPEALPSLPADIPPEIAAEIQAEAAAADAEQIPFAGQVRPGFKEQVATGAPRIEETPFMDPMEYAKLARTSPRKLTDEQLQMMIDETDLRLRAEQSPEYAALMDKLAAEKAARRPPPLQANIPPAVGGAVLGYAYGLFTGDDENRASNALTWALVGAVGGHLAGRALQQTKPPKRELFPGQNSLPKVISYEAERTPKVLSPMAAARRWYAGTVRSTAGLETVYNKTNSSNILPTQQNAAKMASIFGRWVAVAERWMTNKPVILGADGEPRYLDAPTLKQVGEIVGGDIENLDEVAVALTTLENVGKLKTLPMDPVRAHLIVSNATPELIQGAQAMRKYALALADAMVDSGILSVEARDKFAQEQWYTPLQRVFGDGVTKQQIEQLAKLGDVAVSPNPVKGRKGGSTMQVKSPFETLQRMTAQYIRASEYNKIKQQFIAFAKANPTLELIQRVDSKKNANISTFNDQIAAVKKLIPDISTGDAASLAIALGEDIDPRSPIMTMYEDGVLRSYRIHEPVFDAFKAMLPSEMSTALKLFAVPTQLATRGVVLNPFFIAQQFFVDTFQAALMSKYGFRPFVDSIRGWWNVVTRSPEYKRILDLGGPATIQSLPYINPKVSTTAIKTAGGSALEVAAKQIKELHPIEAYKTLVTPIAEAARVGEALRALDHGENTISAVYAAWHATGNTRMQGHFGAMRAFNLLTMFSRPAISAMDEALTKAGVNPFRRPDRSNSPFAAGLRNLGLTNDRVVNGAEFLAKGFAFIGIPSLYLWYANFGDEEIDQLRQTESGQRYWFFRGPETEEGPGQVFKVRKPHVLGQLFGSTLERTLDQMYQRDPENTVRWVGGIVNDAALNVLPQFGVVPFALWGNKIPGLDIPIVPENDLKLEPQLMGAPEASNPARIVASKISPISNAIPEEMETLRRALSPAGLDYIFSTVAGMMGQDAVASIDAAVNYYDAGLVPAKYELPLVGRLFGRYPSMNTRSVRDFYSKAQVVETASLSFVELMKTNPEAAIEYFQRHQAEISLSQTMLTTRQDVANFGRSVGELKELMRKKQLTQDEFRRVEREMLLQIIRQTGLANSIANQVMIDIP